jgi:predicted unusual protein kinase regulating ubiquinone biosynthesis (AarF/ABC1/UbiB family)
MSAKFTLDRYDIEAISAYYRPQVLKVWLRSLAIFVPMVWFIVSLKWDSWWGKLGENAPKRARQVRELLTRLGPAFIKIGQALSTRPDIVPPLYMEELALLQDQLPPFPNDRAFQFIREELGADPYAIYQKISPAPIAAASLGQVYKGKLHSGETVAIKVQRPDILEGIALDIYILRGIASWLKRTFKFIRSNLPAIMDEFAGRIFEEMDYTQEGTNAERFAEYYGHLENIYVPKIYWQYTARRVLTMEWIDGIKLTDLEKIKTAGFDSRRIIEIGVQCSLQQLLDRGFFHADPHPGNLLVMGDGKLAYLDFGMMSSVSPEQRYGLIEAIVHLVNRDFTALSQDYVRLGFLSPEVNFSAITQALAKVFNPPPGQSLTDMNFKDLTDQLSQIMFDYPFQVPAYYALIIRSLVTLEGIALSVDPNFKVLSVAYPYVANRILVDQSPELQSALKELLFRDGEFRWKRLENLLTNAQTNTQYDLPTTVDRVADFLLSDRGEYMRSLLIQEVVRELELLPTGNTALAQKLWHLWTILQKDHSVSPLSLLPDMIPVIGKILTKPETRQLGGDILLQLAQRAVARFLREMVLKQEQETPKQVQALNGRTW